MNIAVIGTGLVGRAIAGRLSELGHDVAVGTRDVERTLARTEQAGRGALETPPYAEWQQEHPDVRLMAFPGAGAHAELVVNATSGTVSLEALKAVGAEHLSGKVLVDLALPLDFSGGMPPRLLISGDDSLGEQIQRAFPDARVVKTLNTVFKDVMVHPERVPGLHNIFVAGDDDDAKETVRGLLCAFGWPAERTLDLGGIRSARSTEMYMQLYFNLVGVLGTFDVNIAVVRA